MTESMLSVRRFIESDRQAVRDICRATAFRNRGHKSFFEDGEIFADYWVEPYLKAEPDLCYVVEKSGRVVGYLLGSSDPERLFSIQKKYYAKLLLKVLLRIMTLQYRSARTYRTLWWALSRGRRERISIPYERFPAHYHANIIREGISLKGYSSLLLSFLRDLSDRRISGLYGILLEPETGGVFSRIFNRMHSQGLREEYYAEKPTEMYRIVLGDKTPMVHRVFASSLETYRQFVLYMRKRYNL